MGTKIAAIAAAALLAGISGVLADQKPMPGQLEVLMAESGARASGEQSWSPCARVRNFVRQYGADRSIEIARLNHTDAEIEYWRRVCFPESKPISRR